jgi:hypothetical protein
MLVYAITALVAWVLASCCVALGKLLHFSDPHL